MRINWKGIRYSLRLEKLRVLFIGMLAILFFNCCGGGKGAPAFYMNRDVDFSFFQRVAVLPFENLTNERFAGSMVRQVVISELLATGLVEVTLPGDPISAIENMRLKPDDPLSAEQIKEIGKKLKVQAVILGAVEEFEQVRYGNITSPEVSITLMMADVSSGSIIWSITKTKGGASFWARHFGARSNTMSETVLEVVREALQTLFDY
jgi:TolB-like protein